MPATTIERWAETPTWMAPHAKYIALYDHPFWREAGLSGMAQSHVGPMAEIHDASDSNGSAALFEFIGLPVAISVRYYVGLLAQGVGSIGCGSMVFSSPSCIDKQSDESHERCEQY